MSKKEKKKKTREGEKESRRDGAHLSVLRWKAQGLSIIADFVSTLC